MTTYTVDRIRKTEMYDLDYAVRQVMERLHLKPTHEVAKFHVMSDTYYGPSWTFQDEQRQGLLFAGYRTSGFWDGINSTAVGAPMVVLAETLPSGRNTLLLGYDDVYGEVFSKTFFGYEDLLGDIEREVRRKAQEDKGISVESWYQAERRKLSAQSVPEELTKHFVDLAIALYTEEALDKAKLPEMGSIEPHLP